MIVPFAIGAVTVVSGKDRIRREVSKRRKCVSHVFTFIVHRLSEVSGIRSQMVEHAASERIYEFIGTFANWAMFVQRPDLKIAWVDVIDG
ncbi:MAG: hypothetical protein JNK90_13210 [Planctomycetaceae bacterium]|nr:hypothetical protein [Planctomycetaceae bacterium]